MTAIRKTTSQVAYFQSFTNLTTDLCTSNDRFGFIDTENKSGRKQKDSSFFVFRPIYYFARLCLVDITNCYGVRQIYPRE